ncbi:N-acetylmuramoyl-L-alanine amidase [Micromonospora peucetia]|uniref:N-acetylmuramoyl-L-alanine amidase n=1 Tax=Micromonospora peucetia TaxID=47871 RepID=A0ABZ1EI48_9ACTN|nr:N-acetylmuramoyl-L-alanine amidase [Micromonospora peucetia]WSA33491.1 N-acetylmuramoyl-L-alanine amidase [Micromonospora peucetia]
MGIPWLADVLRAAGVAVVEEGNWRARGVSGAFAPIGVLWHHTAATSSPSRPAPALGVCINGRSDLPGPLCHALVDYNGVFHLISANRANHAGNSRGSGPIPAGSGNTMLIGWEIDYNGVNQSMTQAQYNASVAATAAVLRTLGRDASYARGHRETSTTGKIDPSFIDLDAMRRDVAAAMAGGGSGAGIMFHQARFPSGSWSGFMPLAGYRTTEPGQARDMAITGMPDRSAQVLIVGADNTIFHQIRNPNGTWTGFAPLAGAGTPTPAAGSRVSIAGMPDGSAQVLIVGANNGIYHQIRNPNGTWTGFQAITGYNTTAPAAGKDVAITAMPDGAAHILMIGADNGVYHKIRHPNGTWDPLRPLTGAGTPTTATGSRVSIAGMPDGSAQVLIVGANNGIYHQIRNPNGTWTGFQAITGYNTTAPAAGKDVAITAMPDGAAHILMIGADNGVYHKIRHPNGTWDPLRPLPGMGTPTTAAGSNVSIAGMPDGSAQVTIVGRS